LIEHNFINIVELHFAKELGVLKKATKKQETHQSEITLKVLSCSKIFVDLGRRGKGRIQISKYHVCVPYRECGNRECYCSIKM